MPSEVPHEVEGWNWGAFSLGPFWALGNKVFWGLLGCLPIATMFMLMIASLMLMPFGYYVSLVPLRILWWMQDIPVYVCVAIYVTVSVALGLKGNEWAWKKGAWANVGKFKRRQRIWTTVSIFFGVPVSFVNIKIAASVPGAIASFFGGI